MISGYRRSTEMALRSFPSNPSHIFVIDYDTSIEFLVSSDFDIVSELVNSENFPTNKRGFGNISLKLISPFFDLEGNLIPFRETCLRICAMGYHPACLRESLFFLKKFPQDGPIVILGSYYNDGWKVPCFFHKDMMSCLKIVSFDEAISTIGMFRIPIVRK